jgi:hypothetical protein
LDMDPLGIYFVHCEKAGKVNIYNFTQTPWRSGSYEFNDTGPPVVSKNFPPDGTNGNPCHTIKWSTDGKYVISGGGDGLRLWNVRDSAGKLVNDGVLEKYPGGSTTWDQADVYGLVHTKWIQDCSHNSQLDVLSVDWHKGGRWVATGEGGYRGAATNADISNVRIWDSTNNWTNWTLDSVPRRAYAVRFSPDGKFLAVGCAHEVRIYSLNPITDPGLWRRVTTIIGFGIADINIEVNSLDWSPDSKRIAIGVGGEKSNKDGDPDNTVGDNTNPVGPDPFIYIYDLTKIPSGSGGDEEISDPIDCAGTWSEWSGCDCTTQLQFQVFTVVRPAENGGDPCTDNTGDKLSEVCTDTSSCTPEDCSGYWTEWDPSPNGLMRSFVVTKPQSNGGVCPNEGKIEYQSENNTQPGSDVGRLSISTYFLSFISLVITSYYSL